MKRKLGLALLALISIGLCAFACVFRPLGQVIGGQLHTQVSLGGVTALNSVFGVLIVDLLLVVGAVAATRPIRINREEALVPTGLQNLAEVIYQAPSKLLHRVLGDKAEVALPLVITFFLFLLVATWIEFFPGFDTIGVVVPAQGGTEGAAIQRVGPLLMLSGKTVGYKLVPFLHTAVTDINILLAPILLLMGVVLVYGVGKMWRNPRVQKIALILLIVIVILAFIGVTSSLVKVVQPHIQMRAEEFPLGPISVPSSALGVLVADLILIVGAAIGTRRIRAGREDALAPTGLQNLVEVIYETLSNLLRSVLGEKKGQKMLPLLITFFLFILIANWAELLPGFDTLGIIEHTREGGHQVQSLGPLAMLTSQAGPYALIPFVRGATTDLNIPLALALVSVFMTQVYGVQEMGWAYFLRFFNPRSLRKGLMGVIDIFVGLLEGLSEFTKIVSFAFRLFGNLFAGMVLLAVISSLVPFLAPIVFYFLELFVGAVQALVFTMLTAAFIVVATAGHGEH